MPSYIIDNPAGGMNRTTSDILSQKSEYRLLMNFAPTGIGILSKVPGVSQIGGTLTANSPVSKLYPYSFISSDGSVQNHLIATCSAKPYYYNDLTGSWLSATVFQPVIGETPSFTVVNNTLLATCKTRGIHKSTDGGITYSVVSASPIAKYLTTFRNRAWAAGDTNFVSRAWGCNIGQVSAWEANSYEVADSALIGLASQTDQLLMPTAVGTISRNNLQQQRTFAYNQYGIQNTNIGVTDYFAFWRTNDDIKAYVGDTPETIGKKVKDILRDGAKTLGECFVRTYNAYLGTLTIDDESFSNVLLTYDIDNDAFYCRDDLDIQSMAQFTLSGKPYFVFGDSVGKVWKIDPAVFANSSGARSEIHAKATSIAHYITEPKFKKKFNDIFVVCEYGEGTDLLVRVDFGQWKNIGQLNNSRAVFHDINLEGHCIQYQLVNNSLGTPTNISFMEIRYDIIDAKFND